MEKWQEVEQMEDTEKENFFVSSKCQSKFVVPSPVILCGARVIFYFLNL